MATDFGKRLKAARAHAGLSQIELAAKAGIAQSTLAAAEASGFGSRRTPQLAVACGVNPHWLATGEGDMLDRVNEGKVAVLAGRATRARSLHAALLLLGDHLSAVPTDRRPALAGALHSWGLEGGRDVYPQMIERLLESPAAAAKKAV